MVERSHTQLDDMLRHLILVGFGALLGWTAATAYGAASASWQFDTNGMLRFLLAILVVTFAHRTYEELRNWKMSQTPVEERLGFGAPVWETRAIEPVAEDDATTADPHADDTEPSQPQG
jgi:hypothetical protein